MRKADLKTGMVCENVDGRLFMVWGGGLVDLAPKNSWGGAPFNRFNEALEDTVVNQSKDWSIHAVYSEKEAAGSGMIFKMQHPEYLKGALLWKREVVEEMTLAQVCQKLGKKIKIIP